VSVAATRQLRLIHELELQFELAFPPTARADNPPFNPAQLVQEPADQLYPSHVRADPDCRATHSETNLSQCYGQAIDGMSAGTLIGPFDDTGGLAPPTFRLLTGLVVPVSPRNNQHDHPKQGDVLCAENAPPPADSGLVRVDEGARSASFGRKVFPREAVRGKVFETLAPRRVARRGLAGSAPPTTRGRLGRENHARGLSLQARSVALVTAMVLLVGTALVVVVLVTLG
jgi:hypothetical protein